MTTTDSAIIDLLGTHDALTARVALDLTEGVRALGLDCTSHLAVPFGDDRLALQLVTSGGAILTAALKREFLDRLPNVRILDALGSSESGAQASQMTGGSGKTSTGDFAVAGETWCSRRISRVCCRPAPRSAAGSPARA